VFFFFFGGRNTLNLLKQVKSEIREYKVRNQQSVWGIL